MAGDDSTSREAAVCNSPGREPGVTDTKIFIEPRRGDIRATARVSFPTFRDSDGWQFTQERNKIQSAVEPAHSKCGQDAALPASADSANSIINDAAAR